MMFQIVATLIDDSKGIIYYHNQAWAIQINSMIDGTVILVLSKSHFLYRSNYLTVFRQTFQSNLFSQSFTDENDSKVKNRRT
jgi:hypothetical protein